MKKSHGSSVSDQSLVQQLVKGLSNAAFACFILGVLLLTVVSLRYQPPDPWSAEPEKALDQVLSAVQNATFHADDSVLPTGEDFGLSAAENATASELEGPAITLNTLVLTQQQPQQQQQDDDEGKSTSTSTSTSTSQEEEEVVVREIRNAETASTCDGIGAGNAINCSDPGVLVAIIAHNLQLFPDLDFFSYQAPVRGSPGDERECDVAWKFRPKQEKSWRKYRDYRRFSLSMDESCNYAVVTASGWHSGKNAKSFKPTRGRASKSKKHLHKHDMEGNVAAMTELAFPTTEEKNLTVMEEVEVIEDSVPAVVQPAEVRAFPQSKYLFYGRGGDHCKKMNHYMWSFLCALGEAQYLKRTLVVDLNLCLSASHNPGHSDEDGKDFRFYFDYAHLKDSASVVPQTQFLAEWSQWNQAHPDNQASFREVSDTKVSPMELDKDESTIIMRKFEAAEPDNYWYRVCEGETETVIQRPWHLLWKSKRIMDIVTAICGKLEWDFDALHVVRGEKASNKELWPNLDADTSAEALVEKVRDQIDTWRVVYIATNERDPNYFRAFKDVYQHAYTIDDFSDLWAKDSLWYNETMELTGGNPVEFDGYMRSEVDTEVALKAKKTIETFGFLTADCKDGVNTC